MSMQSIKWAPSLSKAFLIAVGIVVLSSTNALAKNDKSASSTPSNQQSQQTQQSSSKQSKSNSSTASQSTSTSGQSTSTASQSTSSQSTSQTTTQQPTTQQGGDLAAATLNFCAGANVTAGGVGYTACKGAFSGNDTGSGNPLLTSLNGGLFSEYTGSGTWSQYGKSDDGGFKADQDFSSGSWSLLSGQSLSGTFVLSLKAGTSYSAYLFTNLADIFSGTFNTMGVSLDGSGKAGKALSHASIFVLNTPPAPAPVVEQPKVEQPKVEPPSPVVEQPKVEQPKVEPPAPPVVEQPKVEPPVVAEAPKVEPPAPPVVEQPTPQVEPPAPPMVEQPKVEPPVVAEAPKVEPPALPVVEQPTPQVEPPAPPMVEQPKVEPPVVAEQPQVEMPNEPSAPNTPPSSEPETEVISYQGPGNVDVSMGGLGQKSQAVPEPLTILGTVAAGIGYGLKRLRNRNN